MVITLLPLATQHPPLTQLLLPQGVHRQTQRVVLLLLIKAVKIIQEVMPVQSVGANNTSEQEVKASWLLPKDLAYCTCFVGQQT
jgi:hypothetical protein